MLPNIHFDNLKNLIRNLAQHKNKIRISIRQKLFNPFNIRPVCLKTYMQSEAVKTLLR